MSAINEKKKQQKLAEDLIRKTHFNKFEIECLLKKFRHITKGKLDRAKFRDILHNDFGMTDELLMDRVFKAFDKDNDTFISMEEWVSGLSVYLKGSPEEHSKFCFDVYDLNNDGFIVREEIFTLLKFTMVKQATDEDMEEGIRELMELSLKMMDMDRDQRLSFEDFKECVNGEHLLLEAFGQCLPSEKRIKEYQATFTLQ